MTMEAQLTQPDTADVMNNESLECVWDARNGEGQGKVKCTGRSSSWTTVELMNHY